MRGNDKKNIISSILIFIFILPITIGMMWIQTKISMENYAKKRISKTIESIDVLLMHGKEAADKAMHLRNEGCTNETLTSLRKIVATTPDVRTVNLYSNSSIYCTSIFGEKKYYVNLKEYSNNKLLIMSGNQMTPYRSLIVYLDEDENGKGTLVGIDGYYISRILQTYSENTSLKMRVGANYINEHGNVQGKLDEGGFLSERSTKFEYDIYTDLNEIFVWKGVIKNQKGILFLILVFDFAIALSAYKYFYLRGSMESKIKLALKRKEFTFHIQPIVEAKTKRVKGGEVLIRWIHPQQGFIPPSVFIPIAEKTGIIRGMTTEIFKNVEIEINKFRSLIPKNQFLCFNVCNENFKSNEIVKSCKSLKNCISGLDLQIVLEVTERDLMEKNEGTDRVVKELRELGVLFSLDDFGTGNTNYSYIQRFEPDYIKIDKAYTVGVGDEKNAALFIDNIVNLAQGCGCLTVAEGIECSTQESVLLMAGVDYFQGYLYSAPIPVEEYFIKIENEKK